MKLQHGAGSLHDPSLGTQPEWSGKRAQSYVKLTLATYGTVCWLCGLPGANSADHVIPRSQGGAVYDIGNLGPAHRKCNYARGNRPAGQVTVPVESGLAFFS